MQHDGCRAWPIVSFLEAATEDRRHADGVERRDRELRRH